MFDRTNKEPLKILMSFHYYRNMNFDQVIPRLFGDQVPDIFVDSGAFSAWNGGSPIILEDYVNWIKRWNHWFRIYANLDDIEDPVQTWVNQEQMERKGLSPLPVFHYGEGWNYLERYIQKGHRYIAIGGKGWKDVTHPWIIKCFRIAEETNTMYHGFGMTKFDELSFYPWYSVDSSTWSTGPRYGTLKIFDPKKRKMIHRNLGSRKHAGEMGRVLRWYGFDPVRLSKRDADRKDLLSLGAFSYMEMEQWLSDRHGPLTIPNGSDSPDGPLMYLVDTTQDLKDISLVLDRLRAE